MNIIHTRFFAPIATLLILGACACNTSAQSSVFDRLKGTVDATSKQSDICPVHRIRMSKQRTEILYGLPASSRSEPAPELRKREFPFGEAFYLGGCVVGKDSPKYALVYVCPECQDALKKWYNAHPKLLP